MTPAETWWPVAGFPLYEVSDLGRVRSWQPRWRHLPRPLQLTDNHVGGYLRVVLHADGVKRTRYVHHLVAEAFLGPRPDGMEIRHLNGEPKDNRLANLEYGTRSENANDTIHHGTHVMTRKTHCPQGHPYDDQNTILERRPGGGVSRKCRVCVRRRHTEFMRGYRKRAS